MSAATRCEAYPCCRHSDPLRPAIVVVEPAADAGLVAWREMRSWARRRRLPRVAPRVRPALGVRAGDRQGERGVPRLRRPARPRTLHPGCRRSP
jgi:hypothetical protein